jgi:hypothetical protein
MKPMPPSLWNEATIPKWRRVRSERATFTLLASVLLMLSFSSPSTSFKHPRHRAFQGHRTTSNRSSPSTPPPPPPPPPVDDVDAEGRPAGRQGRAEFTLYRCDNFEECRETVLQDSMEIVYRAAAAEQVILVWQQKPRRVLVLTKPIEYAPELMSEVARSASMLARTYGMTVCVEADVHRRLHELIDAHEKGGGSNPPAPAPDGGTDGSFAGSFAGSGSNEAVGLGRGYELLGGGLDPDSAFPPRASLEVFTPPAPYYSAEPPSSASSAFRSLSSSSSSSSSSSTSSSSSLTSSSGSDAEPETDGDSSSDDSADSFPHSSSSSSASSPSSTASSSASSGAALPVDLVVTLGGDGLLMHANSIFQGAAPPLLSLSGGSLGFLAPFEMDDMEAALARGLQYVGGPRWNPTDKFGGGMDLGMLMSLRMRLSCSFVDDDEEDEEDEDEENDEDDDDEDDGSGADRDALKRAAIEAAEAAVAANNADDDDGGAPMAVATDAATDEEHTGRRPRREWTVLNEVVIERGATSSLTRLEIYVNGVYLTTMQVRRVGLLFRPSVRSFVCPSVRPSVSVGRSVGRSVHAAVLFPQSSPRLLTTRF